MTIRSITVPIEDFGCAGSGALIVERALIKVPGVLRVYVNAATEMAYVQYDADRCTVDALEAAVVHAGFLPGTPILP
ncbi:MAG TPA: heavy metal-associated domain-containing protein [Ktedonobacterales bacterium]|nr:heavy metal-associated domain-containing protein [Ktedonobacterales bacterium]